MFLILVMILGLMLWGHTNMVIKRALLKRSIQGCPISDLTNMLCAQGLRFIRVIDESEPVGSWRELTLEGEPLHREGEE